MQQDFLKRVSNISILVSLLYVLIPLQLSSPFIRSNNEINIFSKVIILSFLQEIPL